MEWPTLVFFAGLFVMVGALVNTGVIDQISRAAADAVEGRLLLASMVLLWGSAVLSAIVDNIPYVATMSPVVADLVDGRRQRRSPQVLWWALALGADLGGNATAVGASANVVILGMAERAGTPDQLLGVHQVRPGRHRRHRRAVRAVPVAALLRPCLNTAGLPTTALEDIMRARDLAAPFPTVGLDTSALEAARLLAGQRPARPDRRRRPRAGR